MQKIYNGFFVDFVTKGYLDITNNNNLKIKGKAFYLYDENLIIYKQFIQIESANFRPTDSEMSKTKYYNRKSEMIRRDILEKIQEEKGFDKSKISKNEKIKIDIDNTYIDSINQQLLQQYKVKSSIDIFSGSNSSGAESNHKATNVITYYSDYDYTSLNFTNPLNNKKIFIKKKIDLKNINQINLISFQEFLSKSEVAKELIIKYNLTKMNILNSSIDDTDIDINVSNNYNKFNIRNILKTINDDMNENKILNNDPIDFFIEKINEKIDAYCYMNDKLINDKIEFEKFVKKLRGYQKIGVQIELQNLYDKNKHLDSSYFANFIKNINNPPSEHCHIIPVKISRKNINTLKEISDPNNCLLLSPTLHAHFDKQNIYFDLNGYCYQLRNNKLINKVQLKKEFLNEARKKYLNKYLKMFVDNHNENNSY